MKRFIFSISTLIIGFVFIFCNASFVGAQVSDTEEFTLEEITVTAQKREENAQKVSMTMEVISSDDIKISGKNDLDEILSNISSIVISSDADGLRINLRGLGDDADSWHGQSTSMPTVALNMDGVYSNRRDTGSALFDLERVEVLYGPQSTLYASNSPGGIVNIITATPKLNVYDLSGTLEYGNYETLHAEGAMNAPLGDKVALRAAFSLSSHDGYLSNGGQDEDIKSARIRALFQPNDNFSFVLTGELSKNSGHFFAQVPQKWIDPDDVDDPWWSDDVLPMPSQRTNKKVYGRMDLGLGFGTLSFVPSYATSGGHEEQWDAMMGTNISDRNTKEKGAELRMASYTDSSLTWIAGVYYYDSSDILDQKTYEDDEFTGNMQYGTMEENSRAFFGNITYPVTDRFRALVGYRRSWSDVDVYRYRCQEGPDGFETGITEYNSSYGSPDYKLGVEYDLSDAAMIYTNWSTSYRAQGMRSMTGSTNIAHPPPEKLNAYTVGSKNRFLDNKLQLNATAFYYDYKNYFVQESKDGYYGTDIENPTSEFTEPDPGSTTWGAGHMMGVDVQVSSIITPKDTLNLTASYVKSEWTDLFIDYEYEWEVTSGRTPQGVIEAITIAPMEDMDCEGKPMTHAPKYTVNAVYKHIFGLWNGGNVETQIGANYKGGFRLTWSDSDYPYNYQKAYYTVDLSATYNNPDGKWSLSGYVRNLNNYAEKRGYNSRDDGTTRIGDPRTYGAVLSVRY